MTILSAKEVANFLTDHENSTPAPCEVLVRVEATSASSLERKVRGRGTTEANQSLFSFPATNIAGTVIRAGKGASRFKQGDEVFGMANAAKDKDGSFAEYILIDANFLGHKPTSLTMHEATTLPLIFIAEWLIAK